MTKMVEARAKSAVITYGRMNPPTKGHRALYDKMLELASSTGSDVYLFLSHTQDNKKNPLGSKTKKFFVEKLLDAQNVIANPKIRTLIDALNWLTYNKKYSKVYFVVGADRVASIKQVVDRYNGHKTKEGIVPFHFPEGVDVVSAGERDPDADDVSGVSASKARALAAQGQFDAFIDIIPGTNTTLKKKLYNELRRKLPVAEGYTEIQKAIMEGGHSMDDDRIIPQGGIGSWKRDALTKNLQKELAELARMVEHDASGVYYHLTKGSIVNKVKALADVQQKDPMGESKTQHIYLSPLKGKTSDKDRKVATSKGNPSKEKLEKLAKKHGVKTHDFEWGGNKWHKERKGK